MSKKMSMSDMKEVRRIITNIISDSVKEIPVISTQHYHSRVSFSTNVNSSCFSESAKNMIDNHPLAKEISTLQATLSKKKQELIKQVLKIRTLDEEHNHHYYHEDESSLPDDYKVISFCINYVRSYLCSDTEESASVISQEYNNYINTIESRTFDAYTKGMSADDFLLMIREEVKSLQEKGKELVKELEKNGYRNEQK